jgi:DNA topoisomerase-1
VRGLRETDAGALRRFGKFVGCSGYPECKNIRPFHKPKPTGATCLQCAQGEIFERVSAREDLLLLQSLPRLPVRRVGQAPARALPEVRRRLHHREGDQALRHRAEMSARDVRLGGSSPISPRGTCCRCPSAGEAASRRPARTRTAVPPPGKKIAASARPKKAAATSRSREGGRRTKGRRQRAAKRPPNRRGARRRRPPRAAVRAKRRKEAT